MFESMKHWFDSLDKQSLLFDDSQDETLHVALASVLYHMINADNRVVSREKQDFSTILKQEFGLGDEQIDHLYCAVKSSADNFHHDLHTVNAHLKKKPAVRMEFMKKLNHLMSVDGVKNPELDIFYETLNLVFPDIK